MKKRLIILGALLAFCMPAFATDTTAKEPWYVRFSIFQPYKEINNKIWEVNKLKAEQDKLSKADKDTLSKYVFGAVRGEDTFQLINCYYMGTLSQYIPAKEITKPLKCRLEFYAKALNGVVSKTRLPQSIYLYAGIDERELFANFSDKELQKAFKLPVSEDNALLLGKKLDDKIYKQKGFLKTYYDASYIHKSRYRLRMKAPKGLQAVLLEGIGRAGAKEVLVNKNYEWKITEVENGYDRITKEYYYLITVKEN